MDEQFDDIVGRNTHVELGINDTYTNNCTQYVKRAKIKQMLIKIQSQEVSYTEITDCELSFYIDYIFDFEDKLIDSVFELMPDVDKSIKKMKKLRRTPLWCKKPL